MIDTVFFDLDGTLLPIDENVFIKTYFKLLSEKFSVLKIDNEKFMEVIICGTVKMRENNGYKSNETIFWDFFYDKLRYKKEEVENIFLDFYENDFDAVKISSNQNPLAKEIVKILKEKGYKIVIATNPLFPRIAVEKRIAWAGLDHRDFLYISSFENSFFSKPNLKYYKQILEKINKSAEQCIMIGNDAREDMASNVLGFKTFLLTDCLINSDKLDISAFEHGTFDDLFKFVKKMPVLKNYI